jgi:hypothetical protein
MTSLIASGTPVPDPLPVPISIDPAMFTEITKGEDMGNLETRQGATEETKSE